MASPPRSPLLDACHVRLQLSASRLHPPVWWRLHPRAEQCMSPLNIEGAGREAASGLLDAVAKLPAPGPATTTDDGAAAANQGSSGDLEDGLAVAAVKLTLAALAARQALLVRKVADAEYHAEVWSAIGLRSPVRLAVDQWVLLWWRRGWRWLRRVVLGVQGPEPTLVQPRVLAEEWAAERAEVLRDLGTLSAAMYALGHACHSSDLTGTAHLSGATAAPPGDRMGSALAAAGEALLLLEVSCGMEASAVAPVCEPRATVARLAQLQAGGLLGSTTSENYSVTSLTTAPSLLARNTLPFGAAAVAVAASARLWSGYNVSALITETWASGKAFVANFAREHLLEPVLQMYSTIRYDEAPFSLQGPASLAAELDSLRRMVVDYGRDVLQLDEAGCLELDAQVRAGDITAVMLRFEGQLKSPVWGLVVGGMLRTALIQVQKGKVDMQQAMSALDKLMRSNELNFQLVALIPAVLLAAWTLRAARDTLGWLLSSRASVAEGRSRNARLQLARLGRLLNVHDAGLLAPLDAGGGEAQRETKTRAQGEGRQQPFGSLQLQLQAEVLFALTDLAVPRRQWAQQAALETMCEIVELGGTVGADLDCRRRRNAMDRLWMLYGL